MKKLIYNQDDLKLYMQEYNNGLSLSKISEKYNLNRHTLARNLKEANINITKRKYTLNEDAFKQITSESAYWLGFIAADGCISATGSQTEPKVLTFNLNVRDKGHLEKFKKFVSSNAIIKEQPGTGYGKGTIIAHLEINSRKMVADLQALGIEQHKSNILKPPLIEPEYHKDWIRGYIDGDGSITILSNGKAQIAVEGTKEVLTFIKTFLTPDQEKILGKRHLELNTNNYNLHYGGTNKIVELLHKIYDDATIYLERKYQIVLEIYSRFKK